jgi:hypothetical protein
MHHELFKRSRWGADSGQATGPAVDRACPPSGTVTGARIIASMSGGPLTVKEDSRMIADNAGALLEMRCRTQPESGRWGAGIPLR